jgi:hypothetical protein
VGIEASGWNTGAAFFDADGDGWPRSLRRAVRDCTLEDVLKAKRTLLVARPSSRSRSGPFGLKGAPDHFFRNDKGRFVEATEAAGMKDLALGFGFAVRAADFDDDGRPDVYVANDSDPNYLYRNEGNGRFKEIGVTSFSAFDGNGMAQASMGVALGDADGDGIPDLFVTNFSEDFATLYKGLGHAFFEDASKTTGVGPLTFRPLKWGTALADFDNDGDLDLVDRERAHLSPDRRTSRSHRHVPAEEPAPREPAPAGRRAPGREAGDLVPRCQRGGGAGVPDRALAPRPRRGRLRQRRTHRHPDHRARFAAGAAAQRGSGRLVADRGLRDPGGNGHPDRHAGDGDRRADGR